VPDRELVDGWIEVNGVFAPKVQADVAATLQRLDTQGVVVETRFWWPGDDLLDWASTGAEAMETDAAKASAARRGRIVAAVPRPPKAPKAEPIPLPPARKGPIGETDKQIARENATARRIALLGGTGLGAAASGVIYLLAADAEAKALDPSVPLQQAEVYREQADSLTWAWIGGSVLAGGLLATVAITW
jgi:hypothetical protein